MPKKYDAFISYSSEDRLVASLVYDALKERGLKAWLDKEGLQPGDAIAGSILEGTLASSCGVLLMSRDYFRKKWTKIELEHLLANRKWLHSRLIPIKYQIGQDEVEAHGLGWLKAVDAPDEPKAFKLQIGKYVERQIKKLDPPRHPQTALVAYKTVENDEVLYRLTTTGNGYWIFPKGKTRRRRPRRQALKEAKQEAGVMRVVGKPSLLTVYFHGKPGRKSGFDTAVYVAEGSHFKAPPKEKKREVGLFPFGEANKLLGLHKNPRTAKALQRVLETARAFVQARIGRT